MRYAIILLLTISLMGCAGIQSNIVKFDDQNAATTLAGAKQIMKHEQMNSSFIRGVIGSGMDKLPKAFSDNLTQLDQLAVKYGADQSGVTEADAGMIIAYALNLIQPSVQAIIQQYWPNLWPQVLAWIPTFLK